MAQTVPPTLKGETYGFEHAKELAEEITKKTAELTALIQELSNCEFGMRLVTTTNDR